ncbi:MAG: HAMP domain-containing histidine kinase [Proteobacteria bacterium]|nr:HAMP domain-containing histidine kinase [Pseudomonadota bacterium]
MAERTRMQKRPPATVSSVSQSKPGKAGEANRKPATTLAQARKRIAELEADLAAANTTISALLDKAELRTQALSSRPGSVPGKRVEPIGSEAEATSPGDKKETLSGDNSTLLTATNKLDQMVRHRTRALNESEKQLKRKNNELRRLNEVRIEFISIATHELRTPLTSIVGYLDLMAEGRFGRMPETMKKPIASLRRNAHRLKHLVDEMLDVSRIDSGRITLYRRPCDLCEIVKHAASALESVLDSKGLEMNIELGTTPRIHADADKIRRATSKLISNAIRHTPEGGKLLIAVDTTKDGNSGSDWVRLRVKGDGRGIPMHLHNAIFEPFTDVETAKHHTSTGPDSAGLGLYIARGLIDLHGGTVSVNSEEGTYTEFTVLLPQANKS